MTNATNRIEFERYSNKSETGSSIEFLDSLNTFNGWKTILSIKNAWVKYNSVDFGKEKLKSLQVSAFSEKGSTLQIRLDKIDGPVIAELKVPKGTNWNTGEVKLLKHQTGIHNIIVMLKDKNSIDIE